MPPDGESAAARERLCGAVAAVVRALAPVVGLLRPRLAGQLAERRAAAATAEAWARGEPASEGKRVLWLHGASAGELLGAAPTVAAARGRGDFRLVVTHFSASGKPAAAALAPAWSGYPPFDAPTDCRRAVRALAPAAMVFATGDLWPGMARAAGEAGVPLGMVNATVREDSSRLRGSARWLLEPSYRRLRRVGAASGGDAERLLRLGVRPEALRVTGDAAFDRALERGGRALAAVEAAVPPGGRPPREHPGPDLVPLLVAGSTWPPDEDALLAAAAALAKRGLRLRLVLVPHQPTREAVARLAERSGRVLGDPPLLWSEMPGPERGGVEHPAVRLLALHRSHDPVERPVVVDAVGLLADLYAAADLAWVGGGFGDDGLHSVVEPAAAGIPVLFGPRGERREAAELLSRGGARRTDADGMADALAALLGDAAARRAAGARARTYVEEGAGAAEAGAEIVLELLDRAAAGPAPAARGSG